MTLQQAKAIEQRRIEEAAQQRVEPNPPPETPTPRTDTSAQDAIDRAEEIAAERDKPTDWSAVAADLDNKLLGASNLLVEHEDTIRSLRRQLEEAKAELAERTRERDEWQTVAEGLAETARAGFYGAGRMDDAIRAYDAAKHGQPKEGE